MGRLNARRRRVRKSGDKAGAQFRGADGGVNRGQAPHGVRRCDGRGVPAVRTLMRRCGRGAQWGERRDEHHDGVNLVELLNAGRERAAIGPQKGSRVGGSSFEQLMTAGPAAQSAGTAFFRPNPPRSTLRQRCRAAEG